jgi:sugar transferase (PEP-CTERM/EpsH1 system associated)
VNILFLANRIPYPPFRGDKLKIYNLAKRLSQNHTLYLITFTQNPGEEKYRKELKKYFDQVILIYQPKWKSILQCVKAIFTGKSFQMAYFSSGLMSKAIRKFFKEFSPEVAHIQHLRMSQYAPLIPCPKILDLPDAYSLYWQRRKQVHRKWYNQLFDAIESARVIRAEKVLLKFDLNLVCSVEDRDFLIKRHKTDKVKLLRNGVDLDLFFYRGHDYEKNSTMLFTGNMDYAPNIDAVRYFVVNLFPSILSLMPEVKLYIVGQRPVKEVLELQSSNVIVTGFVEDIAYEYEKAAVVIAPLRFGAGTQNKVLEAMAMGVPVVCTEVGFKGLEIESGMGCVLSKDDNQFIANTLSLLKNANLRQDIGQLGLSVARSKFSWDGIALQLMDYFEEMKE